MKNTPIPANTASPVPASPASANPAVAHKEGDRKITLIILIPIATAPNVRPGPAEKAANKATTIVRYGPTIGTKIAITAKINDRLEASFGPSIDHRINTDQYITTVTDVNNIDMFGKRYVVGRLDQTTFNANIRVNYTFTPNFTLQTYLQPFVSAGSYSHFKEYSKPESYEFLVYGEGNSTVNELDNGRYEIDPTGGDTTDVFTFRNPDFNDKALVGTLVLRWEFSPGSVLFFVWTHNGANFANPGDYSLGRDLGNLLKANADDIFAIKLSYWIGN